MNTNREAGKVVLDLLEELQLMEGHCPQAALFTRDGAIVMGHYANAGATAPIFSYSLDAGRNWTTKSSPSPINVEHVQFADGSVVGMAVRSPIEDKVCPQQPRKRFVAHVRRARSVHDLIEGVSESDFVPMAIPYLWGGITDDDRWYLGNADGGMVEMPDGNLINTMAGHFRFDRKPVPYFKQPSYQFRVWCCISEDRGRSWQYLSTVASSYTFPVPELAEGFNESDLVSLGENALLCVMRTGGQPRGEFQSLYFPLYASISRDGGLTWGTPRLIYRHGVWPRLLRMSNGVIVCKSGRPGTFLVCSADNGESWSPPHVIDDYDAPWVPKIHCSSGYGSIGEVESGVLTVLYDRYDEHLGQEGGFVLMMRRYRVGRASD